MNGTDHAIKILMQLHESSDMPNSSTALRGFQALLIGMAMTIADVPMMAIGSPALTTWPG